MNNFITFDDGSFVTPVGRIVYGNPQIGQKTDLEGRPLYTQDGKPRTDYITGLALEKNNPDTVESVNAMKAYIESIAKAGFPQLFDSAGNCTHPNFSMKIIDGDSTEHDQNGKVINTKTGYAGHWIFKFRSGFAPECVSEGAASVLPEGAIKCGYFIRILANVVPNGQKLKPGVYLNMHKVELVGYGDVISSGPSAASVFGTNKVLNTPAGMSNIPMTPKSSITPAAVTPPLAAAPVTAPPPDNNFLNAPPLAAAPVTALPPIVEKYKTADGKVWTKEQLQASGYTDQHFSNPAAYNLTKV